MDVRDRTPALQGVVLTLGDDPLRSRKTLPDPPRGDGSVRDVLWVGLPPVSTDPHRAEAGFGSMREANAPGGHGDIGSVTDRLSREAGWELPQSCNRSQGHE